MTEAHTGSAGKAVTADPAGMAVYILTPALGIIRGTLESVPAVANIATFAVEPDGSLSYEHSGGTDMFWDGMATEVREHPDTEQPGAIFLEPFRQRVPRGRPAALPAQSTHRRLPQLRRCGPAGSSIVICQHGAHGSAAATTGSGRLGMALIGSLRDRRLVRQVAVRVLVLHEVLALWKGMPSAPTLPDMRRSGQARFTQHQLMGETDPDQPDRRFSGGKHASPC